MVTMTLGAVLVAVFTYQRFNTPPTNRSTTTALRYHTGAALYTLAALAVYATIVSFQGNHARSLDGLFEKLGWTELSDPLVAAVMLTLLPSTPWLSVADSWVRERIQRMATIPYEVRRLTSALQRGPIEIPEDLRTEVRTELLNQGFAEADIRFDGGASLEGRWTRVAALMLRLREWSAMPRYAGFFDNFSDEWTSLDRQSRLLTTSARSCFDHQRTLPAKSAEAAKIAHGMRQIVAEQVDDLFERACSFVSRGVLGCQLTQGARTQQLAQLGFYAEYRPVLTLDQMTVLFLLVFLPLTFSFVLGDWLIGRDRSPGELLSLGVFVTIIYCTAVACSIFPKSRWSIARRDGDELRPWAFYLLTASTAATAAGVLSLTYRLLTSHFDLKSAWSQWSKYQTPWLTMAFVTAFVTAFSLDNRATQRLHRLRLRVIEGFGQASITLLAALAVYGWLLRIHTPQPKPSLSMLLSRAFVSGLMIGFCVPTWYRDSLEASHEQAGDNRSEGAAKAGATGAAQPIAS